MNNQSELEQFIRKHTFADFAPGGDGSDVVMVDPEVLADYITADSKRVALEARIDERKMAMLHHNSYTDEEIRLLIETGQAYPGDIERLKALEEEYDTYRTR